MEFRSREVTLLVFTMTENCGDDLLPHHRQQELCTTRLPYRQGRKLTAVKVYTINDESKHLLVFGVPSLNLRQETKALFLRFGKLLQFALTMLPAEQFTETYHAVFERIESARMAKKMLDTKNYYGGSLHVCYAPEFESVEETREKILLRQKHVVARLKPAKITNRSDKSLDIDLNKMTECSKLSEPNQESSKMNMGCVNHIILSKRKARQSRVVKKSKTSLKEDGRLLEKDTAGSETTVEERQADIGKLELDASDIEVIDLTSMRNGAVTNIELNYDNFGSEIVKQVPYKPMNRIKFNYNKSS